MKRSFEFWFRGPLMLGLGAVSATVLLIFPLFAVGLNDPLAKPLAVLAVLGVIGLWRATFQEPKTVSRATLTTSILLACGLVAIVPFSGAVFVGMIRNPPALRELGEPKTWFFLWCFFGPAFCAIYFLVRHVIARINHANESRI